MNFEYFISRRIRQKEGASFSRPIIRVSITGIALGLAVMIISVAILQGFQSQIHDKVTGFGGHIQISGFDSNNSYEPAPIDLREASVDEIIRVKGVEHVQEFALKAGIVKTKDQIEGVVFKGVSGSYDWSFFKEKLVSGNTPAIGDTASPSDEILISQKLANLLGFKTGDELRMYFIIDNLARGRKFKISGIYNTGLPEFDGTYLFGDIGHIRKLNGWNLNQVSGVEIRINDWKKLSEISNEVYEIAGYNLNTQTIKQLYPQIFDWIEIQDLNVLVILVLMSLVSGITMISTLLILILEHTRDIGLLKAMGAGNKSIRKIFIYTSVNITFYGLLWGNAMALILIYLQKKFELIPLPEDSYFVSTVPVSIGFAHIFIINAATIIICTLMMLIPSLVIRYISPVKAIRFD